MVAVAVLLLSLVVGPPHATLVSSEPAANAVLVTSPPRLRLVFSEPIEARLSSVVLASSGGLEERLAVTADPRDVHAVAGPLRLLAPGSYRLLWRVVSADGHPVSGSLPFTVAGVPTRPDLRADTTGAAPHESRPAAGAPRGDDARPEPPRSAALRETPALVALAALLRGFALASLMAVAGLLALGEWLLPNAGGTVGRRAPWLAAAALGFLILHAAVWLATVVNTPNGAGGGEVVAALTGSGTGRRELLRTGCALLALWAVGLARRRGIAAVFALAALLVSGAVGHSAAIQPLLAAPAKALHLLAGALWLGGLVWIVLADPSHPRYGDGARRISAFALAAVVVVAATGLVQMLLFLPSVSAVVRSPYGILSLAKIAGLLVLLGFGAYHRLALMPRLASSGGTGSLRVSVRREIGVMLLVILIGGLLAYVPPTSS